MSRRKHRTHKPKQRKRYLSFLTDKDGMGQRDFLLLVSIGSYYGSTVLAQVASLFNVEVTQVFLDLITMQQPLAMVVVGGVMGAQAVETIGGKFADNRPQQPQPVAPPPDVLDERTDEFKEENTI